MPRAVIITGNPKFIKDNPKADAFYDELHSHLASHGYEVTRDPGEPYTEPPEADVWVGHSRGADRLRFAKPGTKVIAVGSKREGAINHPGDTAMEPGETPTDEHYLHAANNIKTEGLKILAAGYAESLNARGACIRPCASGAMGAEPRIPRL